MGLVQYGSDSDSDDEATAQPTTKPSQPATTSSSSQGGGPSMLSSLPPPASSKPKAGPGKEPEKISLAEKRRRMMAMPVIEDSDSEDEEHPVLKKESLKAATLSELLPKPVQGARIGIVRASSVHPKQAGKRKATDSMVPHALRKKAKAKKAAEVAEAEEDASDDEEAPVSSGQSFFSLPEANPSTELEVGPSLPGPNMYPSVPQPSAAPAANFNASNSFNKQPQPVTQKKFGYGKVKPPPEPQYGYADDGPAEPDLDPNAMEDDEFQRFAGARGGRKQDIQVVDISKEIASTADWRRKYGNFKQEKTLSQIADKKILGGTTLRRKGQMTYLMYQAQQNEEDLKGAWAANAEKRRVAKQRYGF